MTVKIMTAEQWAESFIANAPPETKLDCPECSGTGENECFECGHCCTCGECDGEGTATVEDYKDLVSQSIRHGRPLPKALLVAYSQQLEKDKEKLEAFTGKPVETIIENE